MLQPLSLFLMKRYLILLNAGPYLWAMIQSFSDMAIGSSCIFKVSVTCILQEFASTNKVPCVAF